MEKPKTEHPEEPIKTETKPKKPTTPARRKPVPIKSAIYYGDIPPKQRPNS